MLNTFFLFSLILAAASPRVVELSGASVAGTRPRRLGLFSKSMDDKYPEIYDGLKNKLESVGAPEFEVVTQLEQESQLEELSGLVEEFKRTMADTQETMQVRLRELSTFMKP